MTLKDLLVFVDDQPSCAERLRVAAALARRHDAHLTGVHVAGYGPLPPVLDGVAVDQVIAAQEEVMRAAAARAEATFREAMRREDLRHDWRAERGPVASTAALEAHYADLAIVGQPSPDGDNWLLPEDIALLAGRPVLVVPYAGRFDRVGDNPLIAWKPTREAARALHDALPILETAKRATILVVDADTDTEGEVPGDDLAVHLSRHGVTATVERSVSDDIPVADVFLSRAADLGADLLVMGCYGHSRMRELVLGGMTRDIIDRMTLPVLMSH
jgi:nucleotide-binding universal stress UspA family protein